MTFSIRTAALWTVAALLASGGAHAQTSAPAIPPSTCEKPSDYVSPEATSAQRTRLQKRMDEYKTCVNAYVKTNNDKAQELIGQAQAYQDAANKVILDYNAFVTEMNAKTNPAK